MKIRNLLIISIITSIAVILGISFFTIDRNSIYYISRISLLCLLLAVFLHLMSIVVISIKLMVLTRAIGYRVSFWKGLKISLASGFLAAITPSQIGGEPLRIAMLSKETEGTGNATAVVLGERVLDVIFFISMIPIIFLIFGGSVLFGNPLWYLIGGVIFIGIIFFFIWVGVIRPDLLKRMSSRLIDVIYRKDEEKMKEVRERVELEIDGLSLSFKLIVKKKGLFSLALGLTFALWLLDFSVPSVIMMGFGLNPEWIYSIFAQTLITLISLIPLTPGASGIYELSVLGFYSPIVPKGIIGIFILLWRGSIYYFNLIVGGIASIKVIREYHHGNGNKGESE